jgi:cbb3-type cytochrome c oxidase subunit III
MHSPLRDALLTIALTAGISVALAAHNPQDHQHPAEGAHHHPEAAQLKNPVAADATSIAAGQKLYAKNCASCHGDAGKGDGPMGAELKPPPPNLTDADWKHGSSDGEIFTVVKDGVKGTPMKSFNSKMTTHEIWDVVNYVRSIGPKT